ncbi:MAG: DegQ family serine endoprotease [Pyrinomonadaceae bacterium]
MMNQKSLATGGSQAEFQIKLKSLLAVFVVIFTFISCKGQSAAGTQQIAAATPSAVVNNSAVAPQNSYADVVERVSPAVVTINSTRAVRTSSQRNPLFDDPRFREFFGDRMPQQQRPQTGLGSGVIVSPDGYILTNNHVVEDSDRVTVDLNNRRTVTAKVVGTDPATDLAVLKIEENNLPVLPLGNSDRVRVGDVALAIGNQLGICQTVTAVIVSAKGRTTGVGDGGFEDFIQTDAPINRGNSGGALINTNGELIGINSQILSPTGTSIGIGFAIPSNLAKSVMDQLVKGGKVRRSVLGVVVQPINSDLAESLNLKDVRGVIVSTLQPESAAAQAGLRVGDVITVLNGTPVNEPNSFRNQIASQAPGTEITLSVLRDGRDQQLKARLTERTEEVARDGASPEGEPGKSGESAGRLGLSVEPLTPEVATRLNLKAGTQGVVVSDLDETGPAAEAGIRDGDVIERVNNKPVLSIADLRTAVQASGTRPVLMLVSRRNASLFLTVRPRQQQ